MPEQDTTQKVYQYGLLPPTENADLLNNLIFAGHLYKNQSITLERNRRTQASKMIGEAAGVDFDKLCEQHAKPVACRSNCS
jgi:hypothetical protein